MKHARLDADPAVQIDPLIRLWVLRMLIRLKCHRRFVRRSDFMNDDLATSFGFGKYVDYEADSFDRNAILADLRAQHEHAEAKASRTRPPVTLARNVKRLAKMLELTEEDCRILEFAVLINNEDSLDNACDWLGSSVTTTSAVRSLSKILNLPIKQVSDALAPQGLLSRSGILASNRHGSCSIRGKLDLISSSFADRMLSSNADPVDLLRGTVSLSPAPELRSSDYEHVKASMALLKPYLRQSIDTGRRGVNIFLYGPPGTGKTQLARVMASDVRCELFDVSSEDEDGDPVSGERRLRAYRAAQTLLQKRRAMIVFDEMEDVFNDGSDLFGVKSTAQARKAWMNRMLEDSSVPTFWLSNVKSIDPAFIRRFDMIVEVPVPPRTQRQQIAKRTCGDLVSQAFLARLAESDSLAPALVSRATSVVRSLGSILNQAGVESALEHLIGNTLEAQGHTRLLRHDPNRLPATYDLGFLNPDTDIAAIAQGLKGSKSGRLCLYGRPGTGKTAFGRWLAQELDLPLQVKRASDILSPYIGLTERNLAMAFREAQQDGALLMIDEVDSFLRDRKEAQRPWEVTQVNEMLTQMEAFPGVFIASTNLMDGLDQAALRRFDAKIRFDFLTGPQAISMLRAHCRELGLGEPQPVDEASIGRTGNLAPGDFAALMRQHRFRPIKAVSQMVDLLKAEAALKGGYSRPIGFVH